jgi:hypothetical protein
MPTKKESRQSDVSSLVSKPRGRASSKSAGSSDSPTAPSAGPKSVAKPAAKRTVRRAKPAPDSGSAVPGAGDFAPPVNSREPLTHEQIAVRAYYIAEQWRAEGRDTSDEGVWLEAERQMRAESGWNC